MSFSRRLLVFLVALIFSVLVWTYVRLSTPYEADVDLPVKMTAPKGFALSAGLPEKLHARIRGAGWQILLMDFTHNSRFQFDLAERAVAENIPLVLHSDEIANAIMVPSDVHFVKVEKDSLRLAFTKSTEKRVPIEPRLDVTPGRGYVIVGDPIVKPAYVTVHGAPNVLDSLFAFPTALLVAHDVKEDVEQTVALTDSLDNLYSVSNAPKITVHVDIQAIGERVLGAVPITIDALPPQYDVILIPASVNVTVRGGVDQLTRLAPGAVRVRITYDPVVFDTAKYVQPIVDVPRGVTFLGLEPPRVKFILRKKAIAPHATP